MSMQTQHENSVVETQDSNTVIRTKSYDDIAITAIGLSSVAGNDPVDLFGAVATGMGFSKPSSSIETQGLASASAEAVIASPIGELIEEEDHNQRFLFMMLQALSDVFEKAPYIEDNSKSCLIHIVVPSTDTVRGSLLDVSSWKEMFESEFSELNVTVSINPNEMIAMDDLANCIELLDADEYDSILFLSVDSLLDHVTCNDLGRDNRIQTVSTNDGVIPGEAAACILIEKIDNLKTNSAKPLLWIESLAIEAEENAGMATEKRLNGFNHAIKQTVSNYTARLEDIGCIISAAGTEVTNMLEWYQTESELWPNEAPEEQRVAVQLGEIEQVDFDEVKIPEKLNASISLGDIGSAQLMLSLVLACARFDFTHPSIQYSLVLESSEKPLRGAMCVRHPEYESSNKESHAA